MTERLIRSAITSRSVIHFVANGKPRIGEPHLLGTANNAVVQVEVFQTGGKTSGRSGPLPDWRRFDLENVSKVVVTDESFSPRADFNPRDPYWSQVSVSVR